MGLELAASEVIRGFWCQIKIDKEISQPPAAFLSHKILLDSQIWPKIDVLFCQRLTEKPVQQNLNSAAEGLAGIQSFGRNSPLEITAAIFSLAGLAAWADRTALVCLGFEFLSFAGLAAALRSADPIFF
jgi:hypothetical protein